MHIEWVHAKVSETYNILSTKRTRKQVGIPKKARAGFLQDGLGTIRSASHGFENRGFLLVGLV